MGALFDIVKQIFTEKQKSKEEKDYFNSLKIGLQKSISDINDTIKDIKNYDELINLHSEGIILEEIKEPKKDKRKDKIIQKQKNPYERPQYKDFYTFWSETCNEFYNSKCCFTFSFICGFIFCIIQLIGVQEGIIILNALFNEIVDEIKLTRNIPKEYDFYQKIEIASYKSIPDIDVGMFWSFVGIIVLKKYGFICSNIFQLLSLIGFLLLFLLFDFHKKNKLSVDYTNLEITVLIISYFLLCISVGASSTIAIKQFYNLYLLCYKKYFNLFKYINLFYWIYYCMRKNEKDELSEESKSNITISNLNDSNKDKFKDSKSEENTFDQKMKEIDDDDDIDKILQMFLFYNFSVISLFAAILLNRLIFSSFDNISSKWVLNIILIIYSSCFVLNLLFYLPYSIPLINHNITKIMNKQKIVTNGKKLNQKNNQNTNENSEMYLIRKIKQKEAEIETLKKKLTFNETAEKYYKILNVDEVDKFDKNVPQKVCTCIGYVYFQKKIGDKNACIFYDYDSCYSWFWFKFKKPQIYGPLLVEFLIQLTVVGFNTKLSDNLLKVYSFSKNLKFFLSLLVSIFYMNFSLLLIKQLYYFYYFFGNIGKFFNKCSSATVTVYLFLFFSLYSFICSIVYLVKGYPTGKNWENTIMSEIVGFKMLDLNMLVYYDFFDDEDCLNTSVIITFERFVWTIIEVLIDIYETKLAILISLQIAVSFIIIILSAFIFCFLIYKFRKSIKI